MTAHVQDTNILEDNILSVIVLNQGPALFTMRLLENWTHKKFAKSELKVALIGLCKKKKIITIRKINGERLYRVPFNIYLEQAYSMSPLSKLQAYEIEAGVVEDGENAGNDIVIDMLIFIGWVVKEQPVLGKKGQLDKKNVDAICSQIQISPALTDFYGRKHAYQLTYPTALTVLIDLALRMGIVSYVDNRIIADEHRLLEWITLSQQEVKRNLYALWFMIHYPVDSALRQLLAGIPILSGVHWYFIHDLFDLIEDHDEAQWEQTDVINRSELYIMLQIMRELGWIQTGRTEDGQQTIRSLISTIEGNNSDIDNLSNLQWFVQPDFELIVPSDLSYEDHYLIGVYAKLKNRDRVYTYHISKPSVLSAFQHGWTAEDILKHLVSHARYGVPENVQNNIKEWEKQYAGVQIESAMLLRCKSGTIVEEILSIPEITGILSEQSMLQPNVFLIEEQHVSFIRRKLREYGFEFGDKKSEKQGRVHNKADQFELSIAQTEPHIDRYSIEKNQLSKGLFHSDLRYDIYTVEESFPDVQSIYPGLTELPIGWLNDYHTYHNSTKKKLIQQAIDWECYIHARLLDEDVIFSPIVLEVKESSTWITGYCRGNQILIDMNDISTLKLIVPGIHDVAKYT